MGFGSKLRVLAVLVVDLVSPSMVVGVRNCVVVVVVNVHQSTLDYVSRRRAVTRSGLGARQNCCWADNDDTFGNLLLGGVRLPMHLSSLDVDLTGEILVHVGWATTTWLHPISFWRHCLYSSTHMVPARMESFHPLLFEPLTQAPLWLLVFLQQYDQIPKKVAYYKIVGFLGQWKRMARKDEKKKKMEEFIKKRLS